MLTLDKGDDIFNIGLFLKALSLINKIHYETLHITRIIIHTTFVQLLV